jgi:hypothetical protein
MPSPEENPRAYNDLEREVMDPFKPQYMNTTTPGERKTIAQAHIFPALFNHWSSIGINLTPDEMDLRTDVSYIKSIYHRIILTTYRNF